MKLKKAYYGSYYETIQKRRKVIVVVSVFLILITIAVIVFVAVKKTNKQQQSNIPVASNQFNIPQYDGSVCIEINGCIPFFQKSDLTTKPYEYYSPLDYLGRCGVAIACLGNETMPTDERGSIGMIKPSGWKTVRYDDLIEDKYLYNRCHLIAYMLSGENDNEKNLITGTRYFNISGMLPYESKTSDYIKETGNHVLYRVTPYYVGKNLVASGVLMEAYSVEDNGQGLKYNVFIFNVQPGIQIDYSTGDSYRIQ